MREFSSYYFAKANEIPQINYVDIAYFETMQLERNPVKQNVTIQTSLKKQELNTTKSLMGKSL